MDGVIGFDWHIATKYYTADILLCATRERTIGDREFANAVEAFVVCFDADQVSMLLIVNSSLSKVGIFGGFFRSVPQERELSEIE